MTGEPSDDSDSGGSSRRWSARPSLVALFAALLVTIVLRLVGADAAIEDSLGAMGFDPDRAVLIAALILEFLVVASAVLIAGRSRVALACGGLVLSVFFGATFVNETRLALATSGPIGQFDLLGWGATLGTLILVSILLAGATTVLAAAVRGTILSSGRELGRAIHARQGGRRLLSPIGTFVIAGVIGVAIPIFSDMVNYEPDTHMVAGGALPVGSLSSAPADSGPPPSFDAILPGVSASAGATQGTGAVQPGASPPWLAWTPSGRGSVRTASLPGPWIGGAPTAGLTIYVPAGYDGGSRRYPVLYEVPWGMGGWAAVVHVFQQLDVLTASGTIPPEIVVFVSEFGGPYLDSECVNSADGREWYERYLVDTVVPYVDATYRTVASPPARALMGFSAGGYCAPMLLLRHPDVFSSAIAFSGYFTAAIRDTQTPNAWRPYGGDQALIDATSPMLEVAGVPRSLRTSLFVALSANPASRFYGSPYKAFAATLHAAGIEVALFPSSTGHAWVSVRDQLPAVLAALATRQAATGVFG